MAPSVKTAGHSTVEPVISSNSRSGISEAVRIIHCVTVSRHVIGVSESTGKDNR